MLFNTILNFAQYYGEGPYGSGLYSADKDGGQLANTGFLVALVITIACLLIFTALVVRMIRKKPSKTT